MSRRWTLFFVALIVGLALGMLAGHILTVRMAEADWNGYAVPGDAEPERTIGAMQPGDTGWTVPWALDEETGELNPLYTLSEVGFGTATMFVQCVAPGEYEMRVKKDN